jgi:import inner membrane translocase subunit TIM21
MSAAISLSSKTALSARCVTLASSGLMAPAMRRYATGPSRRSVTVANDNGSVAWSDLSGREKAARTTQQTFNFGMVIVGVVMTGGVGYFLYDAVFSTDSKVSHFNRAVDELKESPRVRELIGPANKIKAYGDPTGNRWTRNRTINSTVTKDRSGRDNMLMHFYLEGPSGKGRVNVHMVRKEGEPHFEYKVLKLDVPGHASVYLHNTDAPTKGSSGFKFLGATWK